MSLATAAAIRSHRVFRLFEATIVRKAIMAVTGIILFGYVVGHLLGNLQVFAGRERLDEYAALLKHSAGLLWGTRLLLLICVTLHVIVTIQLAKLKSDARPVAYKKRSRAHSSLASRTMYYSGPLIFFFVLYHLLHLTFGVTDRRFVERDVYNNLVYGFQNPLVSIVYILAIAFLMLHLNHGLYSMFQTLGATHPRYTPKIKRGAALVSVLLFIGYVSIPIAVMAGIVHL